MTQQEVKRLAESVGLYAKIGSYGQVQITRPGFNNPALIVGSPSLHDGVVMVAGNLGLVSYFRETWVKRVAYSYGTQDGRCFNRAIWQQKRGSNA
jgi:hypothetical protein